MDHFKTGKLDEALTCLDEGVMLNPKAAQYFYVRAGVRRRTGQTDEALKDYGQAIQVHMEIAEARQPGVEARSEEYEDAILLERGLVAAYSDRGELLLETGDYDGAMASLDKAVALGKADVDTYAMKSDVGLKRMQSKYGTDNAQQLRAKMTPQETAAVCGDLQKALGMGLMDMQKDMFAALVCK